MSDNPNIAPSHEMNHAGINTLAELREDLEQQKRLFLEARLNFFSFIGIFGPIAFACIGSYIRRDRWLEKEVNNAVVACAAQKGPEANQDHIRLKIEVKLYTILSEEYRDCYFTALNLFGSRVFRFIQDHHNARNNVVHAELGRLTDMISAIWLAGQD